MAPRENKVVLFLLGLASSMQQGFFCFFVRVGASAALTASLVLFFSRSPWTKPARRGSVLRLSARDVIPPRAEVLDLKASRQCNADWDLCFRFQ